MSFSIQCAANNVWYGTFAHFNNIGICHGLATRIGGLSEAPFYSLNMGLRSGDDVKKVAANRELFFQALGIAADTVVSDQQIHGDTVAVVTAKAMGRGALNCDGLPGTDALVTNTAGVALMVFSPTVCRYYLLIRSAGPSGLVTPVGGERRQVLPPRPYWQCNSILVQNRAIALSA